MWAKHKIWHPNEVDERDYISKILGIVSQELVRRNGRSQLYYAWK